MSEPKQFSSQKELMDYVDHCTAGVVAQRDALLVAAQHALKQMEALAPTLSTASYLRDAIAAVESGKVPS